jgi:hypothetical protein
MKKDLFEKWHQVFPESSFQRSLSIESFHPFDCPISSGLTQGFVSLHENSSDLIIFLHDYGDRFDSHLKKIWRFFHSFPVSFLGFSWDGHDDLSASKFDFQKSIRSLEILLDKIEKISFIKRVYLFSWGLMGTPVLLLSQKRVASKKLASGFLIDPPMCLLGSNESKKFYFFENQLQSKTQNIQFLQNWISPQRQYELFKMRLSFLSVKEASWPLFWFYKEAPLQKKALNRLLTENPYHFFYFFLKKQIKMNSFSSNIFKNIFLEKRQDN